jgi:hypothetical protein
MKKIISIKIKILLLTFLFSLLMAWPTMLLWNGVAVKVILGLNYINFWQALGLNILSNILFKSLHLKIENKT